MFDPKNITDSERAAIKWALDTLVNSSYIVYDPTPYNKRVLDRWHADNLMKTVDSNLIKKVNDYGC